MKKKLLISIGLLIILLTIGMSVVNAYQIDPSYKPQNAPFDIPYDAAATDSEYLATFILQLIAGALLYFAAPVAVIMIAMTCWNMITGGADTEKIEQSKKHLTWSIIGLIAIILSYSIVRETIKFVIQVGESADIEQTTPQTTEDSNQTPPATGAAGNIEYGNLPTDAPFTPGEDITPDESLTPSTEDHIDPEAIGIDIDPSL